VKPKPRVLFVHGAGVHDGGPLAAYLRRALADHFDVHAPRMPQPDEPAYEPWKAAIESELERGVEIAIGHSLGGSVLLKLLAERQAPSQLTALFTVAAPYWGADDWSVPEFALPADLSALDPIPRIGLFHSRDDEIVPFAHLALYAQRLPRATVHAVHGRGHEFEAGLPELVAELAG
jgi:predicted alpha/beta hydrolase family esterase